MGHGVLQSCCVLGSPRRVGHLGTRVAGDRTDLLFWEVMGSEIIGPQLLFLVQWGSTPNSSA